MASKFNKKNKKYRGSIYSSLVLAGFGTLFTIISFIIVMTYVGQAEATLTFVRKNVIITLAGGCAFYIILFIVITCAINGYLKRTNKRE